jgi:hypothetical protein
MLRIQDTITSGQPSNCLSFPNKVAIIDVLSRNQCGIVLRILLTENPAHRFTDKLLKAGLSQVFLALDYRHTEAKIIHTGTG